MNASVILDFGISSHFPAKATFGVSQALDPCNVVGIGNVVSDVVSNEALGELVDKMLQRLLCNVKTHLQCEIG